MKTRWCSDCFEIKCFNGEKPDQVGASYLYEEIQKAVDQATKIMFAYFYSA